MAGGFYTARYQGMAGAGGGAFYIGNGIITGADVAGGVYDGTYEQQGGRLNGTAKLGIRGGGSLVTGKALKDGETVDVTFSLPTYFSNGEPHGVSVEGKNVGVIFTKVRDLP